MDVQLINYAYALKQIIEEQEEVIKLNRIEAKLENDQEVNVLHERVLAALEQLSEVNKYSYLTEEQKKAQKALHLAKLERDKNPLIREYLAQYKIVKVLYDFINREIFDPFCESDGIKCRVK